MLLPVHNGKPYLEPCLDSVLRQSISHWELVLVDDASEDGSTEQIQAYAQADSRIRLVSSPHRIGVTAALNLGLQHCRGEFIARLDADDICVPHRLERQRDYLRTHPTTVAVGCWVMRMDADGDTIAVGRWPREHAEIDRRLLGGEGGLPHPGAMIRAASLQQIGGYREEFVYAQDKDLWLRLGEVGQLANLSEVLLHYREHVRSAGSVHRNEQELFLWRAVQDARLRRKLAPYRVQAVRTAALVTEKQQREAWVRAALRGRNMRACHKHLAWLIENDRYSARTRWLQLRVCAAMFAAVVLPPGALTRSGPPTSTWLP